MAAYIQTVSATHTAFTIIDEHNGKVAGSTSLYHIDEAVPRVEIGFTWYAQSAQRTHVNMSCKLMLLAYAFEMLGYIYVDWHIDILDTVSQRAIERLGVQKGDILRHYQIREDDSMYDTVMYSILHKEWSAAQAASRKRLE